MAPDSGGSDSTRVPNRLKNRGLSAEKAVKCCKERVEDAYQATKQVEELMRRIGETLEIVQNEALTLSPPKIVSESAKVIAEVGTAFGLQVSGREIDLRDALAQLEVPIKVAYSKLRKLRDSCEDCIANAVWGQDNKAVYSSKKHRTRKG